MFGHDWDKAEATIVARDAKFTGDGSTVTYTYVADERLSVKGHHASRKKDFEDAQNQPAGTAPAAWSASAEIPDAVAATLAQLGIVAGAPGVQTPETRLQKLQALHDSGLLTGDEYAEQRRRILGDL